MNRQRPHLLVLPEDDANRQLANGFHQQVDWNQYRQMKALPPAGGWRNVLELLREGHLAEMNRHSEGLMSGSLVLSHLPHCSKAALLDKLASHMLHTWPFIIN